MGPSMKSMGDNLRKSSREPVAYDREEFALLLFSPAFLPPVFLKYKGGNQRERTFFTPPLLICIFKENSRFFTSCFYSASKISHSTRDREVSSSHQNSFKTSSRPIISQLYSSNIRRWTDSDALKL